MGIHTLWVLVANDDNWLVSHMIPNDGHLFPVFPMMVWCLNIFPVVPMFKHVQTYC